MEVDGMTIGADTKQERPGTSEDEVVLRTAQGRKKTLKNFLKRNKQE